MKNNQPAVKKNISSMQVLKTLQVMLDGDYSMSEIVEKLNSKEKESIFNSSVVSKYINTCRYCGIEIPKIHNKYFVTNIPFGIKLSPEEVTLITNLKKSIEANSTKKFYAEFDKAVNKITRYTNKQITKVEDNVKGITEEPFKKAIQNEQKVRLMLRSKEIIDCIPLEVKQHKNKKYFNILHNKKYKMISFSRVSGLQILNEKFNETDSNEEVVFKLSGKLSQKYTLRENEKIITDHAPEYIIVSNIGEARSLLLPRLLRYGELCEVQSPTSFKEEIINAIDAALANYGAL